MSLDVFTRLRAELSLWYAGVFGMLLVVLGLVTYGHLARALTDDADGLNMRAVKELHEGLDTSAGRLAVRPAAFADEAEEARDLFNTTLIGVYDAQGRPLAQRGTAAPAPVGPEREAFGDWQLLRHPVLAPDGRRVGTLVVGHDMRDRRAVLARLARDLSIGIPLGALLTLLAGFVLAGRATRPVRAAMERQRRFIADASHELRTPVAIVQAQAEAGRGGDEAAARAALDVVQRTAERMGRLVGDLLLLTRADAAVLTIARRHFFLDELAEEVVTEFVPLAGARLRLRFERRAADVAVEGDPEHVHRLLANLLDNALAHSPAGGEVVVAVEREPGGQVVLSVRDQGAGLAAADAARIFERFYRVQPAARPGTGLGLAIVKAIAEVHGGTIAVVSAPGAGAEFRFRLPEAGPAA